MIEWFRDWADPRGAAMREVLIPWSEEWATLKRAPEVSYDWVFPGARTSASIAGVD
jgi:hypothetical protein